MPIKIKVNIFAAFQLQKLLFAFSAVFCNEISYPNISTFNYVHTPLRIRNLFLRSKNVHKI